MTHAQRFQQPAPRFPPPAPLFPPLATRLLGAEAVLDGVRFVASASPVRSPTLATVACFSIATIAEPFAGTPDYSSAPSDASADTSSRIPSINTPAVADVALGLFCCLGVDFLLGLTNL
jgi:hypothetical protein